MSSFVAFKQKVFKKKCHRLVELDICSFRGKSFFTLISIKLVSLDGSSALDLTLSKIYFIHTRAW